MTALRLVSAVAAYQTTCLLVLVYLNVEEQIVDSMLLAPILSVLELLEGL